MALQDDNLIFLDFEASSLRRESYPIEAGIAKPDTGETASKLIKPLPSWTDWDPKSQAIHNIPRTKLVTEGERARKVAEWLIAEIGERIIVSDNPDWERFWLDRLLTGANMRRRFAFVHFHIVSYDASERHFSTALERDRLNAARRQERFFVEAQARAALTHPKTHRAGEDAANMLETYRILQAGPSALEGGAS